MGARHAGPHISTATRGVEEVDCGLELFLRSEPSPLLVGQAIREVRLARGAVLTYSGTKPTNLAGR